MSVFDVYQDDFVSSLSSTRNLISKLGESSDQASKDLKIAEIESSFSLISANIKQMEIEARTFGGAEKRRYNEIIVKDKDDLANLRSEFNNVRFGLDKASLTTTKSGEQRGRVIDINQKIADQNTTLEKLQQTIASAQQDGEDTLEQLGSNREVIQSALDKSKEFSGVVAKADTLIQRMTRRDKSWGFWS